MTARAPRPLGVDSATIVVIVKLIAGVAFRGHPIGLKHRCSSDRVATEGHPYSRTGKVNFIEGSFLGGFLPADS